MIIKENTQFNNQVSENIEKIRELFPNTVTESDKGLMVDFDKLKEELSSDLMDSKEERYQMTWPGKKASLKIANEPTDKTLIPDRESSEDFDNTQNIYIEGDNLEALKILKKSYEGKIKCIYIDPPYNTGKDFIYNDNFSNLPNDYLKEVGIKNEQGDRLSTNKESSGRFHSRWLTMMYPRLKLARELLKDNGVIYISIDDNEVHNLKLICDEIFGINNFIREIIWLKNNAQNDAENIEKNHEYILVYKKSEFQIINSQNTIKEVFIDSLDNFYYMGAGITTGGEGGTLNSRPNLGYTIYFNEITNDKVALVDYNKDLAKSSNIESEVYTDNLEMIKKGYILIRPPKKGKLLGRWSWSIDKFNNEKNKILITKNRNGYIVQKKELINKKDVFEKDGKYFYNSISERPLKSFIEDISSSSGTKDLNSLFNFKVFDNPKPRKLIEYLIKNSVHKGDIVLDFFSGSATTADSIMSLNSKINGNIKYILCQFNELLDEEEDKLIYDFSKNVLNINKPSIPELGKERIRRAGTKIKEETNADIDYGFKVFKVSDSILNPNTEISPNTLTQEALNFENIKESISNEDLLYFSILKTGRPLDSKIIKEKIDQNEFFIVLDSEENNIIVACFDKDVNFNEDVIKMISDKNPLRVYFRDSTFKSDNDKINFEQKLKELSSESIEMYVL